MNLRPRSGVMRGTTILYEGCLFIRYFSYEALDKSYQNQYDAYSSTSSIDVELKYFVVGASSGAMGGRQSQEFMVENEFGEDVCAITDSWLSQQMLRLLQVKLDLK